MGQALLHETPVDPQDPETHEEDPPPYVKNPDSPEDDSDQSQDAARSNGSATQHKDQISVDINQPEDA